MECLSFEAIEVVRQCNEQFSHEISLITGGLLPIGSAHCVFKLFYCRFEWGPQTSPKGQKKLSSIMLALPILFTEL
jgi:hypothetical protein